MTPWIWDRAHNLNREDVWIQENLSRLAARQQRPPRQDDRLDEGERDRRGRHRTWEYGQFAYKGRLSAKLDRIRHRLHPRLAIHEPSIRYDSFMTIHRSGG